MLVKTMPRYFFNLTNGDSVADEVEEEFDGVEAARGHAMTVAKELSRGRLPRTLIGRHISVVDERGKSLANSEPSTHGTERTYRGKVAMSALRVKRPWST